MLNPTYSFEVNKATIDYVRDIAALAGLNMEAKFIGINETGLNKTHNKAVIVDRSKVLISSINWNEHSPTNNREVGLIIHSNFTGSSFIKSSFKTEEQVESTETTTETFSTFLCRSISLPFPSGTK